MSRIGKKVISCPKDLKVDINGSIIKLKGTKGELEYRIPVGLEVQLKDQELSVSKLSADKQTAANHGTIRSILNNIVHGVTQGHKKDLEIQGIGFRVQQQGSKLVFSLGFSHPVEYNIPDDVKVQATTQTAISVEGLDKERVGQVAANIRALKPVEPYKGKGIRYVGEHVRRKQGKSVKK